MSEDIAQILVELEAAASTEDEKRIVNVCRSICEGYDQARNDNIRLRACESALRELMPLLTERLQNEVMKSLLYVSNVDQQAFAKAITAAKKALSK